MLLVASAWEWGLVHDKQIGVVGPPLTYYARPNAQSGGDRDRCGCGGRDGVLRVGRGHHGHGNGCWVWWHAAEGPAFGGAVVPCGRWDAGVRGVSHPWLEPETWKRTSHASPPRVVDWEAIADALYDALESFTAYDGMGQGGSDDSNQGGWTAAYTAEAMYREGKAS